MAKKVGQAERKFKLNVFFQERTDGTDPITIKGLARGWASERWDNTTGDPYFYEFKISAKRNALFPDIELKVNKSDGSVQILAKEDRNDLRNVLKDLFQNYWWNNRAPLSEIPVGDNLEIAALLGRHLHNEHGSIPDNFQMNFDDYLDDFVKFLSTKAKTFRPSI